VRCWDDIVVGRQQGACLVAHRDALAPGLKEARRDADNVAKSKVRQQAVERQAQLPQDVPPQARFPVLQLAAAERRVAARMQQAQRRDVQPSLKLKTLVQRPKASQRRVLRWSGASADEPRLRPQGQQGVQLPERLRDRPRGRGT
jgi:hypothetical protein